jgi:hypothetical protein
MMNGDLYPAVNSKWVLFSYNHCIQYPCFVIDSNGRREVLGWAIESREENRQRLSGVGYWSRGRAYGLALCSKDSLHAARAKAQRKTEDLVLNPIQPLHLYANKLQPIPQIRVLLVWCSIGEHPLLALRWQLLGLIQEAIQLQPKVQLHYGDALRHPEGPNLARQPGYNPSGY